MGRYNPHIPQILGQEWVPIREENLVYNQAVNNVELGHTFLTDTNATGNIAGRFYTNQLPDALARYQVWTMAVYNRGEEAESGPINRVLIPVSNGGITGSNIFYRNTTTVQTALFDASDRRYVEMQLGNSSIKDMALYFDVNKFSALLTGKRILGVNLIYSGEILSAGDEEGQITALNFTLRNVSGTDVINYPNIMTGTNPSTGAPAPFLNKQITRIQLGDTNMFFNPTTGVDIVEAIPWTFTSLQRFDFASSNAVHMHFHDIGAAGDGPNWSFDYAAMEVFYCEETRVAVGSTVFQYGAAANTLNYRLGYNNVPLYTPAGASVSLTVNKSYTVTLSQGSLGDAPLFFSIPRIGPQPKINAVRQLYPLEVQVGVQVNIPSPPTPDIVGQTLTRESTQVLPQLSLHNNSTCAVIRPVHAYGRMSVGQVYGANFVSQAILDTALSATASYTMIKFWARRFGATSVPLTVTGFLSSTTAQITPNEFDALDPIIDGWKEVTLPLVPPITLGAAGNPFWTWTSVGESAGNRWEVLGAVAPTQDGIPGQPTTGTLELGPATYGFAASGSAIFETWLPQSLPYVSVTTADPTADVAFYVSQTPPNVTSFAVSLESQALSGIGLNCGVPPAFIPTSLDFNQLTWAAPSGAPPDPVSDTFTRTVSNGWGSTDTGQAWTIDVCTVPTTQWSVNGSSGVMTHNPCGNMIMKLAGTWSAVDAQASFTASAATDNTDAALYVRYTDVNNYFRCYYNMTTGVFTLERREASTTTSMGTAQGPTGLFTTGVTMRLMAEQTTIRAKFWLIGTEEPEDWTITRTQFANLPTGQVAVGSSDSAGNKTYLVDNFSVRAPSYYSGYTELQRMDDITDWQTIMKATDPNVTTFNDYEARVGMQSDYRIRNVNLYGFVGNWSSTVSATIPAPGVTATDLGATDHVFIFTTNEVQDGTRNLAYSPAYEGTVEEDFNFPETASQTFQTMYNRDYVTVFRPEERGGTNFTRNMLVQAAAIDPATLEDFTSLRDMAWADVSYICVRDEDANRWFANVSVPSGNAVRGRRLYMAPVNIVQVTDTPTEVDP